MASDQVDYEFDYEQRTGLVHAVSESFLLQFAVLGLILVALGFVLDGILAGLVPIYGFVFVLLGLGGHGLVALSKRL
jgi:hypothetical protein